MLESDISRGFLLADVALGNPLVLSVAADRFTENAASRRSLPYSLCTDLNRGRDKVTRQRLVLP